MRLRLCVALDRCVMPESNDALVVISFRGPKALAERVAKAAKKRGCARSLVQREALEMYLTLVEKGLCVVRSQQGAFGDGFNSTEETGG